MPQGQSILFPYEEATNEYYPTILTEQIICPLPSGCGDVNSR
jgi:hypothetical protein